MVVLSHRNLQNYVGWTSVALGGLGGMLPCKKMLYILRFNTSILCSFRDKN